MVLERPDSTADTPIGLLIVLGLAGLAGAVDACGFFILKDLYVSFMSGNTTSMAAALAKGDLARVRLIAGIIAAFVTGVAAGTVLGVLAGRRHVPIGILTVAGVLAVPIMAAAWSITAMTFAMGMLNATIHQAGPVEVSLTYITGTLAKLGKGIGLLLCGRVRDLAWLEQTVPFLGLVAGAAVATFAVTRFGADTMLALPVIAVLIATVTWFAEPPVH
jgi:uncharacterized membrane protein YoaK (UPF0700 family)